MNGNTCKLKRKRRKRRKSENGKKNVFNAKTNRGQEVEMSSEHSFWLQISEKTYHICELTAFKLGKMSKFTWEAA